MGSCASLHKQSEESPAVVTLKLSFRSTTDKLVPVEDNLVSKGELTIADVGLKSQWSPHRSVPGYGDLGSTEEDFFDSQPWLESDCEDDFFSFNGDSTPSGCSTPVYHSFLVGTPKVNTSLLLKDTAAAAADSESEPSPTDKKKKLAELFKESLEVDEELGKQNSLGNQYSVVDAKMEAKATSVKLLVPNVSVANSANCSCGRSTPAADSISGDKSGRSAHCCLP